MYIRRSTRKYGDRTYTNHLLVESIQTPKGPRQKTICSLGDLSPRPAKDWLKLAHKIEGALLGQKGLIAEEDLETKRLISKAKGGIKNRQPREMDDLIKIHIDKVETALHREAGPVHVGYQFWRRLGLDVILSKAGLNQRVQRLACAMTLNRLIFPLSEHAMPDWIRSTAIEDILGVDFKNLTEDALYRNLDKLYPRRAAIESALVGREGNLQDRETLDGMLQLMNDRVGLSEGQTVVIDRGMAYDENIEQIRKRNLHYIVASRQSERNEWFSEFEELEGFEEIHRAPSPLNPFQKKSKVRIKKIKKGELTYVLCISSGRVEKDKAIRHKQEERFLLDVEKLQKRVEKGNLVADAAINEAIGRLKERYPRVARYS